MILIGYHFCLATKDWTKSSDSIKNFWKKALSVISLSGGTDCSLELI